MIGAPATRAFSAVIVCLSTACTGAGATAPSSPSTLTATVVATASHAPQPRSTESADLDAQFAYDANLPLDLHADPEESVPDGTLTPLTFASPRAGVASGFLARPAGTGPFPAILLMPGSNAPPSAMRSTVLDLMRRGAIAMVIDQSQTRPGHTLLFSFTPADRDETIATVIDLRRALDVLSARPDVDRAHLGYWGFSHGAFLGGILSGVDRRVRAYVLQSGGGADYLLANAPQRVNDAGALAAYRAAIATVDPVAYVRRAAPAELLLQNGTQDHTYNDAGVAEWVAAASDPKQVRRYDAGHQLNDMAAADAMAFLTSRLGLVAR